MRLTQVYIEQRVRRQGMAMALNTVTHSTYQYDDDFGLRVQDLVPEFTVSAARKEETACKYQKDLNDKRFMQNRT